jgi:hypothetical protein
MGLKHVLAILVLAAAPLGAFGQGKVSFQNDGASRITLGGFRILPGDQSLAGQPIPTTGPLPSGITMIAGLYAGTSSGSLALVSSVALNPIGGTGQPPGIIPTTQVTLPFPGGSLAYMQVKLWDAAFDTFDAELAGCPTYFAWTPVFTMTPGILSYPSITRGGGTTWQETPIVIGFWNLDPTWPVIHQQPQSQTVSSESSASFFVGAFSDGRMMYYRWYKDGVEITNATSSGYTIARASPADAGLYSVEVYNPCGSCSSEAAMLTVAMKPVITQSPLDQTAGFGASAEFTVSAVGGPPLSYQWLFYGRPIWGASSSALHLTYVQPSQAGTYAVIVTNAFGTVTSSLATLTVAGLPQPNRPAGAVVGWGYDYFGESTVPASLSVAVAVAAGEGHSLALLPDGSVVGWGDNRRGQSAIPTGLRGVIAIAAGASHSLALKSDGTVVAWGDNSLGQEAVPPGLTGVTAIAAGGNHSLALKSDGTVVGWGYNEYGQITPPAALTNTIAIAAGTSHSLALKSDGTVVAWGYNFEGQSTVPPGLHGVVAIAAGGLHSLALGSDGTVVGWGDNYYGQITIPPGLTNVIAIAGGGVGGGEGSHSLALKSDGTVVAWGDNSQGQATVPAGLAGGIALAAGGWHSLALTAKPILLTPPANQTAELDSTVTFDAYAIGHAPLVYQWLFNSTNVVSAATTNSRLRLKEVQFSSAGPYSVFVSNAFGAVTSPPAMLQVIAPVERRPAPALNLLGDAGSLLNLDYANSIAPAPIWLPLHTVSLVSTSQLYFDLTAPLPAERFYRVWQTGTPVVRPSLTLVPMVPAITLTGNIGDHLRLDYINQFGPVDAWVTLDTVTLTNTSQLYFDVSVIGQPPRLWRIVPGH